MGILGDVERDPGNLPTKGIRKSGQTKGFSISGHRLKSPCSKPKFHPEFGQFVPKFEFEGARSRVPGFGLRAYRSELHEALVNL